ncbi:h16_B2577 [Cupriavidus necator H16]|uniref:H16_B2577 protein n=1 Tax=Cupriavidus necator (strain ATCC 17699 / DSM 428 / KCTC 22496 / NCIMB 10442 / H16 / Stanier 337) TaxID=381666 RepID=Q0JY15_CUPNH|nr:h16_B2577 [Cupriavidus necator H16]
MERLLVSLTGPIAGRRISPAVMIIPVEQHPPALHVCGYHLSVFELVFCLRGARVSRTLPDGGYAALLTVWTEMSTDRRTALKRSRLAPASCRMHRSQEGAPCRAPLCHVYSSVHLGHFVQPRVGDLQPISYFGMRPRAHWPPACHRHLFGHITSSRCLHPCYAETGTL